MCSKMPLSPTIDCVTMRGWHTSKLHFKCTLGAESAALPFNRGVCSVYSATVCVSRETDSTLGVTCLCTLCTKVASYCYIGIRVEPHNVEFSEICKKCVKFSKRVSNYIVCNIKSAPEITLSCTYKE